MSMMKKTAALTVSAVLLLQPMTASAVTWNNIVTGLRNSGSNSYTEDGTTIEKDGDNYTVTGGTIENGGHLDSYDFNDNAVLWLKGVLMEKGFMIDANNGEKYTLIVDKDTVIKNSVVGNVTDADSKVIIINDGTMRDTQFFVENGGYASTTNNGNMKYLSVDSKGNGSTVEFENTENGTMEVSSLDVDNNGTIHALNNGTISNSVELGMGSFKHETTGYTIAFINNGEINSMRVGFGAGTGTMQVENNGTFNAKEPLTVSVKEGTTVEEILQKIDGMPNAEYVYVCEYQQDEYGDWEQVNRYYLRNPDEPENPDGPENPNKPETPEQPEETQQPTFEVSKYDQERHEMEEKRKAEAIGGVYGSPYWVKQLYLGYHSLNLRLFVGEQQSNFKQSLSWMPDSTKQLTLRVNTDAPEKLTMRLDEKALETLERTEFSVITLLDKSGNAVMQYSLSDLRSVYDQYGLSGDDQMVVGGANDDVMKIVNGEMKPIEA